MIRLAQFRTFSAFTSVLMSLVLALSLLLLSQSVSQAAKPTRDLTPPTVSTVVPANNATDVAPTTNVEATFSEAMRASTINGSTFTLAKVGTTTPVAAQVTYDPSTNKATLDPTTDLAPGATYTATVQGGKKGVKDLAGNALRNSSTWSLTTAAAPPPDTTPPDTTIDSGPSATAPSTSSSASFTFSSTEPNSTFECKLDDAAYSSCTTPKTYSGLANGSHTFYVRAIDAAGNVDPTPASFTWLIDTTAPMVALTFDDGPDPTNTPKILDILQLHNVKATFFVVGNEVNKYPDLVRREYEQGHMVGNHSYTHRNLTDASDAEVRQELQDTNAAITAAGVPQPNLFRPPYGSTNGAIESIASSLGMTQTLWALDAGDFSSSSQANPAPPAELCDRVVSGVGPGSIVVMHDGGSVYTADALDCIITRLKAQGYTFAQPYPSSTYNSLNSSYVEIR